MLESRVNNLLQFFREVSNLKFDGVRYVINNAYKSSADKFGLQYEEYGDELQLKIKAYFNGENVKYYESIESEIRPGDVANPILLVSLKGTMIRHIPSDNLFNQYGINDPAILQKFKNIIAYFKLFDFLRKESFCDYYNDANKEIIIYSSVNGIIKVKYDAIPVIKENVDFTSQVYSMTALASPIQISPFFKNALFTISKGSGIIMLNSIIHQAEDIITITKRDYELVSKKFDFEKFRDALYKEKEKFFSSIREIINKIFSQAIGIPISISASVFATYKVSDDIFMLLLVLIAFVLYVCFYIKVQCIYRSDLGEIERDFNTSFSIISAQSGLTSEIIEAEREKITQKLRSTKEIICWLIYLIALLGLLVSLYIGYEIFSSKVLCIIKLLFRLF